MDMATLSPIRPANFRVVSDFLPTGDQPQAIEKLVEGVNRIKKHTAQSANERGASSGGIVTQEAPIHVSNVMVVDSDGTPTRVGYRVDEESGKRVRISKRNGKDIQK